MKEHEAQFRFYEELNDFLPRPRRKQTVHYDFNGHPAIKDPIEALGVPHTEVDLVVANGESVGFGYQLQPGDRVAVYPVFESFDISPIVKLRGKPLRRTAFVLDVHLGKLARILRLLGFDVTYRNNYDDAEIIRIGLNEHRIILTRDRRMLFNRTITHGHWLHSTHSEQQAREVLERFDLAGQIQRFLRCPACNMECRKIYWKGSHYDRIVDKLDAIVEPGSQ